jgi:hypothetical protein
MPRRVQELLSRNDRNLSLDRPYLRRESLSCYRRGNGFTLILKVLRLVRVFSCNRRHRAKRANPYFTAMLQFKSAIRCSLAWQRSARGWKALFLQISIERRGLAAVIALHPDLDQETFARIARTLVEDNSSLRNLAAAPDLVIRLIYPLAGNEAALGLDYRHSPTQRAAALRARDTGQPILAGPLPLVQGGVGVLVREPVFVETAAGERRFWGLVSAVMDAEAIYQRAGLRDPGLGLAIALRGTDGSGSEGPVFYGNAQLFAADAKGGNFRGLPAWRLLANGCHPHRRVGGIHRRHLGYPFPRLNRGNGQLGCHPNRRAPATPTANARLPSLCSPAAVGRFACRPPVTGIANAPRAKSRGSTPQLAGVHPEARTRSPLHRRRS